MSRVLYTAEELKARMTENDNRFTASPYLLLLRQRRTMVVDGDYCGKKRWVEEYSGDYHTADTKEELITTIRSWYDDEEEFSEVDHLIKSFYEEEYKDTINVFLTDKGYQDHLTENAHNLGEHDTYGIHAFRNKEMASLVNLIDENIRLLAENNKLREWKLDNKK